MQRPRNRNRAATLALTRRVLRRLAACLLLVSLLGVMGCRDDSGRENARQAAEYRRLLDASGKRVLIVDAQGRQQVKLRKRRDQIKVYGEDLKALGYVRWGGADAPGEPVSVRVHALGSPQPVALREVERPDGAGRMVELDGYFRIIEQLTGPRAEAPSAWRVLGPDHSVIGIFQKTAESEWQLLSDPVEPSAAEMQFEADYRAEEVAAGERMKLVRDKEVVATVEFGALSAPELLALQLDELPRLQRVSLGVWLTQNALQAAQAASEQAP